MPGLLENFYDEQFKSLRRNVGSSSRTVLPYALDLVDQCRTIVREKNVDDWNDPVYQLLEEVNGLLQTFSSTHDDNAQRFTACVQELTSKAPQLSDMLANVQKNFEEIQKGQEKKKRLFRSAKLKLPNPPAEKGQHKPAKVYLEIAVYHAGPGKLITHPVSDCTSETTLDLVLLRLTTGGHLSLRQNPHFYHNLEDRLSQSPYLQFRFECNGFQDRLKKFTSMKTSVSRPLKLYCLTDTWEYPRLLLKTFPQRAFVDVRDMRGHTILKDITGILESSHQVAITYQQYATSVIHREALSESETRSTEIKRLPTWDKLLREVQGTVNQRIHRMWTVDVHMPQSTMDNFETDDGDSSESEETLTGTASGNSSFVGGQAPPQAKQIKDQRFGLNKRGSSHTLANEPIQSSRPGFAGRTSSQTLVNEPTGMEGAKGDETTRRRQTKLAEVLRDASPSPSTRRVQVISQERTTTSRSRSPAPVRQSNTTTNGGAPAADPLPSIPPRSSRRPQTSGSSKDPIPPSSKVLSPPAPVNTAVPQSPPGTASILRPDTPGASTGSASSAKTDNSKPPAAPKPVEPTPPPQAQPARRRRWYEPVVSTLKGWAGM